MKQLYICDIDGTVANLEHRVPLVSPKARVKRWEAFKLGCIDDKPKFPVIETIRNLLLSGAEVWLFTGRMESSRGLTNQWLSKHMPFYTKVNLTMRPEGDYTPDDLLKERWYKSMLRIDQDRLIAVFDDRQRVVDMWRKNGVTCFQVAEGDF